jgi:hypothetical protein
LVLLFTPGRVKRYKLQGFYVLPTQIADRARPVFEEGLAVGGGPAEEERLFTPGKIFLTLGVVGVAVGLFALFVSWGTEPFQLGVFAYVFGGGVFLYLKLLVEIA